MLRRAASNAYSWWWASNIRTKQSKWLDDDLQDMEEKVRAMTKLIEADADSFGKKAELYFRRRPELLNYVEEMHKAYKTLADRYDRVSGELHKANHTIASAFPDQVEFAMGENFDDDDDGPPKAITAIDPSKARRPTDLPHLAMLNRNLTDYPSSRKPHHKKLTSLISKEKAQEEIDRLQKEILVLQTEKEFVKSSYESTLARYLGIERDIVEMQEEVCGLQDTYSASAIIEDDEARALMAATAIKSCEDSLVCIKEQQKTSDEEARIESGRIKDAQRQLMFLKGESSESEMEILEASEEFKELDSSTEQAEEVSVLNEEKMELQSMCEKVKQHFGRSSESSVVELAEKIDELVDKVIGLEVTVSSQTTQIKRLRSETDELHEQLQTLEQEKAVLVDNSNSLSEKLTLAETELHKVQHLEKCINEDKGILQKQFIDACQNLNNLSGKLLSPMHQEIDGSDPASMDEETTMEQQQNDLSKTESSGMKKHVERSDDTPDLQDISQAGRDKALLNKYTTIVRNYKDTKEKLSEIEKKNQEYHLETMAQVKELKSSNAMKDEEIRLLKEILNSLQTSLNVNTPSNMEKPRYQVFENSDKTNTSLDSASTRSPQAEEGVQWANQNEPQILQVEAKFRADIDTLLEENLDFWLRFSTSYHQIQEFQKRFKDIKSSIDKLNEMKNAEGNADNAASSVDALCQESIPIDKKLRELNTELHVWLEKNALLNGELKCRFSSLCSIQDDISRVSKVNENEGEEVHFSPFQAAKFQGEVLSMQLENNKVAKELQAGLDYVKGLQVEVSWTLSKLNKNYELSAPRTTHASSLRHLSSKTRIPLRTFLFGVKPKKPSLFSCMSPALHKQYSNMGSNLPR